MLIFLTFDTKEERDKFIYLYSHYLKTVYYTVTRFVSEPYAIEDLSQDVFLALSKHLDKCDLSNPTQTRNYIITIARNRCKNYLRDSKKLDVDSLDDLHDKNQDAADIDILKIMLKKDTKKKLIEEIRKLNDIYKEVLELKYIAQFSNQEIADFLHIEKKTVEMRLYRANNILRERLRDWYYES